MLCVRSAIRRRFYCAAVISASVAITASSQADAAGFSYWTDSDSSFYRPAPLIIHRSPVRARHHQAKPAVVEKDAAKPQGPLIVAISINKQQVKIYDSNGLFAEAPVSTGMKGHPTPTGVFSIIQKQKYHRSNIYSGAPMPFMQRITWSGVALHAGVLPGYPASHGCIRMPPAFAVKMYGWTRIGARVLVTSGEVEPSNFTHPLLAALKAPQPSASAQPDTNAPAAPKADKGAALSPPVTVGSDIDLRSTIGHDNGAKSTDAAVLLRGQTRTADAGSLNTPATVTDVPAVQVTPHPASVTSTTAGEAALDAPSRPTSAAPAAAQTSPSGIDAGTGDIPTKPGVATMAQTGTVQENRLVNETAKRDDPEAVGQTAEKPADAAATKDPTTSAVQQAVSGGQPEAQPIDKSTEPAGTTADSPAKPADKDQTRVSEGDKPLPVKPELKRNSAIAIFISRKDSKLYVRQNFSPVFKVEVTIAPSDRPLGTHVFTASTDKADADVMHWSVVSLPVSPRSMARNDDGGQTRHGKKRGEIPLEAKDASQPNSPAEALDRIAIPADVLAWLGAALSNGSSLIVSDQGINQGETGEGTEFILSLR
ncbi:MULTISPECIES: L,D-transpeptidase family protein [unclassified Bradyrhizobium]|uniref:L,D-transpeptidase family protein n=1 Tax=Bradyrhizobium sp. SZCCHNR2009 TaxID=3057375 RepID=UPI0028E523CC|nr:MULTISPECIES: L,D-transpeptidase family protein [unclassified Bradyrhizobium]